MKDELTKEYQIPDLDLVHTGWVLHNVDVLGSETDSEADSILRDSGMTSYC